MKLRVYFVITAVIANFALGAYLANAQSFPSEITLQQSDENRYFPLHMGKYWKWDISAPKQGIRDAVSEEAVVKDLGNVFINGTRNFKNGKIVSAVATVYRMQRGSVYTTEQKTDYIGGTPVHIAYETPCLVMPDRPLAEMTWSCETTAKNPETGADENITDNYMIESIGDVKTETNHYRECVKIRQDRTITGADEERKINFNMWYCAKSGLTKIERDGVTILQLIETRDVEVEIQEEEPEETPAAEAPVEAPEETPVETSTEAPTEEELESLSLEEQAARAEARIAQYKASAAAEQAPAEEETTAIEKVEPLTGNENTYDIVKLPPYPDPEIPSIGIIGWSEDQKRVAYLEVLERGSNKPVRTALKIIEVANNDVVWNYSRRMCGKSIEGCSAGDIEIESDDVDYARIILLENRDALRSFNIGSDSGFVYVIPEENLGEGEDKDKQRYFALVMSPSKQSVFTLLPGGGKVSGEELDRGWQYVAGGSGAWKKDAVTDSAQAPAIAVKQPEVAAETTVEAAPKETVIIAETEAAQASPSAEPEKKKVIKQQEPTQKPTPAPTTAPETAQKPEPEVIQIETTQPAPKKPEEPAKKETPEKAVVDVKPAIPAPAPEKTVKKPKPEPVKIVVDESESMATTEVGEEEKMLPVPPTEDKKQVVKDNVEDIKKKEVATEPEISPVEETVEEIVVDNPIEVAATEHAAEEIAVDKPAPVPETKQPETTPETTPEPAPETVPEPETKQASPAQQTAPVPEKAAVPEAVEKPVKETVVAKEPEKKDIPSWQKNIMAEGETDGSETGSWVNRIKTNSDGVQEEKPAAAVPTSAEMELAKEQTQAVETTEQAAPEDIIPKKPEKLSPPSETAVEVTNESEKEKEETTQPITKTLEEKKTAEKKIAESAVKKKQEAVEKKPEVAVAPVKKPEVEKPKVLKCPDGMAMIPAGEFMMGCSAVDKNCENTEKPAHRVKITKQFCMNMHEVTQAEFQEIAGRNPSDKKECGSDCPVESVTWTEAAAYCEKTGGRLPTEAQWEYAARGGSETSFYWGNDPDKHGTHAWSWNNSMRSTHRVGLKIPNEFNLYDMAGNVWEWTGDCYTEYDKSGALQVDPFYEKKGCDFRVIRGGSWVNGDYNYFRASKRNREKQNAGAKYIGFRCIAEPGFE